MKHSLQTHSGICAFIDPYKGEYYSYHSKFLMFDSNIFTSRFGDQLNDFLSQYSSFSMFELNRKTLDVGLESIRNLTNKSKALTEAYNGDDIQVGTHM
jgi:hypothetical protein